MTRSRNAINRTTPNGCLQIFFRWNKEYSEAYITEWIFALLFLSFLESDFVLLWYKTLHSEVVWTEENTDKSESTLFAALLITVHKVLWCQNTLKVCLNMQAKQGQSFHLVCILSEWGKGFFA